MQSFTCPDCENVSRYQEDAGYGYCPRCMRYTGLCEAGRVFHYPGWVHAGNWQVPCKHPWTARWEVRLRRGGTGRGRFCDEHGQAVSRGTAPVGGSRMAGQRTAPPAHRRRGGVRRALRMAFGKVTEEEMARNRARYLARRRARW